MIGIMNRPSKFDTYTCLPEQKACLCQSKRENLPEPRQHWAGRMIVLSARELTDNTIVLKIILYGGSPLPVPMQ